MIGIGIALVAIAGSTLVAWYFSRLSLVTNGETKTASQSVTGDDIDADTTDPEGAGNMTDEIDALEDQAGKTGAENANPESPWIDTVFFGIGTNNISDQHIRLPAPLDLMTGVSEAADDPAANAPYIE